MSSGTLSQNEIDRLLKRPGVMTAGFSAGVRPTDAQLYDFRRPHRVSKERLRTLEAMYEQVVKTLEGWLLGRIRGTVELRLQSVEQFTFGEFTLSLPAPCASYVFDIFPGNERQGVIDFGPELASFLVDRLFGGSGRPSAPGRALTPIERMAVKSVADRLLAILQDAWQDHVALEMAVSGFESMPEILRAANGDDAVLVGTVEVTMGDVQSLLLICLPFTVLEGFFAGSGNRKIGTASTTPESREAAETMVRTTSLPISARLPVFQLPLREIANIRVGGVLSTGIATDVELEVRVSGQPRFKATAGRTGRRLAIRINDDLGSEQVAPDPEPETPTES